MPAHRPSPRWFARLVRLLTLPVVVLSLGTGLGCSDKSPTPPGGPSASPATIKPGGPGPAKDAANRRTPP